jgi:hypothetical protein
MIEFEAKFNQLLPGVPMLGMPMPIAYVPPVPKRPAPRRKPRMILHPEHPAAQRKSAKGLAKAKGKGKGKGKAGPSSSATGQVDDDE